MKRPGRKRPHPVAGPPIEDRLRAALWALDNPEPEDAYGPDPADFEPRTAEVARRERFHRSLDRLRALTKRFPASRRHYARAFVWSESVKGVSDEEIALGLVDRLDTIDRFTPPHGRRGRNGAAKALWISRAVDILLAKSGEYDSTDRWERHRMAQRVREAVRAANQGALIDDAPFADLAAHRWTGGQGNEPPGLDVIQRAISTEITKRQSPGPDSEFGPVEWL